MPKKGKKSKATITKEKKDRMRQKRDHTTPDINIFANKNIKTPVDRNVDKPLVNRNNDETQVDMTETQVNMTETQVNMTETQVDMTETQVDMTETQVDMTETQVDMTNTFDKTKTFDTLVDRRNDIPPVGRDVNETLKGRVTDGINEDRDLTDANHIVSDGIVSHDKVSDHTVSDYVASDDIVSDDDIVSYVSNNKASDDIVSYNVSYNKASDDIVSYNVSYNKASDYIVSYNVSYNKASDDIVSYNVSNNKASDDIVSYNIASDDIVSYNIASDYIVSDHKASNDIVSDYIHVVSNADSNTSQTHEGRCTSQTHEGRNTSQTHEGRCTSQTLEGRNTSQTHEGRCTSQTHEGRNTSQTHEGRCTSQTLEGRNTSQTHEGRCTSQTHEGRNTSQTHEGRCTSQTLEGRNTSQTHEGRCTSQTHEGRCTSQTHEGRNTSQTHEGRCTSQTHEGRNTSKTHEDRCTSQTHEGRNTSQTHEGRNTSQTHEGRYTSQTNKGRSTSQKREKSLDARDIKRSKTLNRNDILSRINRKEARADISTNETHKTNANITCKKSYAEVLKGETSNDYERYSQTHNEATSRITIIGSFHQGSLRFGYNAGKQCVANCLVAFISSFLKPIITWNQSYVDNILIKGNELYTWIHGVNELLLISDLPSEIEVDNTHVNYTKKESYAALIDPVEDFPGIVSLDQAIQESLIDSDGCFICVNGFTSVVIKQNDKLFLFDSHSRNSQGLPDVNGSSLVMELNDVDHLYGLLCRFVNYNSLIQFEITGISVESINGIQLVQNDENESLVASTNDTPHSVYLPYTHDIEMESNDPQRTDGIENKKDFNLSLESAACDSFSDVEMVEISSQHIFEFSPIDCTERRRLCKILNISNKNVSKAGNCKRESRMGCPRKTKNIQGDGNCLFRALSYAISQRQDYYKKIRQAAVNHILSFKDRFTPFTSPLSVEEHISSTNMARDKSWGTAVEILAIADLLKTDIFTYSDSKWIKYSAKQIDSNQSVNQKCIYLRHSVNHYDVVIEVDKESRGNENRSKRKSEFESPDGKKSLKSTKEREKYHIDIEFRESRLKKSQKAYDDNSVHAHEKYMNDDQYRENRKKYMQLKYENDEVCRQKTKNASILKYANDQNHRENLKNKSISKYATDEDHRKQVKNKSINKYATDEDHRKQVKNKSINKYATDEDHRKQVKNKSINKYATDEDHREEVKNKSIKKYATDEEHRQKITKQNFERKLKTKEQTKDLESVISSFREEVKKGPEHICACCFRLLFDNQVIKCNTEIYESKGENVKHLARKCISYKYLHSCIDASCPSDCNFKFTSRASLWICYTCHRKILRGQYPAECHNNNLELDYIPPEMSDLNSMEQHLLALNIPFMKVLGLPKGGQKGVHGPVVCVPSNLKKVTSLPRSEDENNLLPVKLKRKLAYKGYQEFQFISTKRLKSGLSFLKKKNFLYSNVQINDTWLNPIPEETNEEIESEMETSVENNDVNGNETVAPEHDTPDTYLNEQQQGIQLDTCLQPADIGQEVLDQCFDEVFNISPAEGNKPIRVLTEEHIEAKSFPIHFPTGKNTVTDEREKKLSLLRYFNLRLMCADNRFAKDSSYIFFAQYLSELDRVISNVQISLRKDSVLTSDGKKITGEMLCSKQYLNDLLKSDQAIKYLKPVRGTPPYWQAAQKDIFALIRQIGKPTFFCSFSSADFRWKEMVETIMNQQGIQKEFSTLDWNEKCKILNSNPVTLARMFEHRFHIFLHKVILSDAHPIGKVVDYFYRIEFQMRGSPHAHCLFWIENAPSFGEDPDEDVIAFINKYITCSIPRKDEDPELHDMVSTLHQHSKNHSKSCKKKGTACRFNFPRPPSAETFIAKETCETAEQNEINLAKQRLMEFWECLLDATNEGLSFEHILKKVRMTQSELEDIISILSKRNTVFLKREVNEMYTNHYNEHLLRAWNANMDIQYVLDAFACVVYIISYISKAERELGMLLQQTKNEAQEGNLNAQQTMRKIGTAYLHHREISVQEAVYRVTGLKLKECSRKVEFIPVGENPSRMSLPLNQLKGSKKKAKRFEEDCDDNEDDDGDSTENDSIWMISRVDRYRERPCTDEFDKMCLAEFTSNYDVLSKSQIPQKINTETTFKLKNDLGYIRKRTRGKPAIIRYPRFSVEISPEKYYQSMIQLFLPYRVCQQLKPQQYATYEDFYNNGHVRYGNDELVSVKSMVDKNKSEFIKNEKELEDAQRIVQELENPEDAWGNLCPQTELERLESNLEGNNTTVIEDELTEETIPDLNKKEETLSTNLLSTEIYSRSEILPLLRTLNLKQRKVFYEIRNWCLLKVRGEPVEPFHVFVTGGGGTGKSHLIKCLYYEMTRILARTTEKPDDQTVLLTAPTGTAAFNISGLTLHSALSIFKTMSFDHVLLSEDKINALRSKLDALQVIIIDEISMVNKRMLFFVHQRLRQIKKMPEDCLFGGVSVLVVGDFYQLPPVKTKRSDKLYVNDPSSPLNNLWFDLFQVVQLDEIMRQRGDTQLSEMLNRLRVKKKEDKILHTDLSALKQCIRNAPDHVLHIYATNEEVKSHNNQMVMKLDSEVKLIEAEDYVKDKTNGKLVKRLTHFPDKDIQLSSSLLLAVEARVMLIKNIQTTEGLVNGVIGTIKEIIQTGSAMPDKIFVHFDNAKVGKNYQHKKIINGHTCVGLEPSTEDIPMKSGSRKQFPLKLAWACTVHKVQGMTVQECAVDLSKCFSYGQGYVALSRVTSLNGLYINDIDDQTLQKKVYCDPDVDIGVKMMKPFIEDQLIIPFGMPTLLYHNIEGLINHIEDLKVSLSIYNTDMVCLTETWMKSSDECYLEGYNFRHLSRYEAYDRSTNLYASLKDMNHGGVGVFYKNGLKVEEIPDSCHNLECILFKVEDLDLIVATVYRTQNYQLNNFLNKLRTLIQNLLLLSTNIMVCGDFNQDLRNGSSSVETFMISQGFEQCVQSGTTESGTIIDHVYIKGTVKVKVSIIPTYYSYHEALLVQFEA